MIKRRQLFTGFSFFLFVLGIHFSLGCYSQNSIGKVKILVVEKNKFKNWQAPTRVIFKVHKNVTLKRYNNENTIRGKIDSIADSAIFVKGKQINLKDIRSISSNRATREIIIGLSSMVFFTTMYLISNSSYQPNYDSEGDDLNEGSFSITQFFIGMSAVSGGIYAADGIIKKITIKRYRMDKGCKLFVENAYKKK